MKKIKLYLAGKIGYVKRHESLRNYLSGRINCEVFLPHEFVALNIPKEKLPREAFKKCVDHINKADAVIADITVYGKDTTWEIGYCYGIKKKVIGFASDDKHKKDFMVKGSLLHVVRDKEEIVRMLKNIFRGKV
jgi:nucleoside 2-deoxyribosyltransferase